MYKHSYAVYLFQLKPATNPAFPSWFTHRWSQFVPEGSYWAHVSFSLFSLTLKQRKWQRQRSIPNTRSWWLAWFWMLKHEQVELKWWVKGSQREVYSEKACLKWAWRGRSVWDSTTNCYLYLHNVGWTEVSGWNCNSDNSGSPINCFSDALLPRHFKRAVFFQCNNLPQSPLPLFNDTLMVSSKPDAN